MAPESNTPNAGNPAAPNAGTPATPGTGNAAAPIHQNVAVPKPATGTDVNVASSAGGQLQLGFDPGTATATRSGNDLSFQVDGGGKVTVKDFFAVGDESLPSLRLPDGTVVASKDFFSGSGLDMTTAAGPGGGGGGAAGSGSGEYRGDPGDLIGGIDRYGKLGTDFWGRGSEVPNTIKGLELPGGDFGMNADTNLGAAFAAGVFEDARPMQHIYGDSAPMNAGQIHFNFTPTGTTVVDAVHLNGFDQGTRIFIGDPANGGHEVFPSAGGVYTFAPGDFNPTGASGNPGVYIIPPANSDHDMDISASVDYHAQSSGMSGSTSGTFTIIVDAVADKPNIIEPAMYIDVDGYNGSMTVDESNKTQKYEDGWAKDSFDKTSGGTPDASHVDLTVKFSASLTFGDFGDGSEHHYALVEVPSNANIQGNFEAGAWTFKAGTASEGLTYHDTVVIRYVNGMAYDTEADARAHGWTDGDAEKTFFRFEVDNSYLQQHLDPNDSSKANINVGFEMEGKGSNITGDVTFDLDAGAQAKEAPGDKELDLDNNNSYTWVTDGDSGHTVPLGVDTVDSRLFLKAGWVAEGNNPNKNLLPGDTQNHKWTGESYENEQDSSKSPQTASYGDGAPLSISIDGGPPASAEHITGASFTFGSADASLRLAGVEIANGAQTTVGGVTYTFTVSTAGGETTVSVAVSGPNAGGVTNLDALDMTFVPKNYYEDADIQFKYTVDVEAASGAKAHYEGSSTVVVDAVADISGAVTSNIGGATTHVDHDTSGAKLITTDETGGRAGDGVKDFHEKSGWETDTYKLDYSSVKYGFAVHVETTFPDVDGSEKHYVLVEKPSNPTWGLGDLTGTGLKYTAGDTITIDGKTYWKLEVVDATKGDVKVDVPLQYNGSIAGDLTLSIKTGSYVEEQLKGDAHDPNAAHSGREYDMQNNTAVRTDGTEVTYKIDVINSALNVMTGWGSEGANDAKHIGGVAGAGYQVTGAYAASTGAGGTAYDGCAPILFNLGGGAGSAETISSVTFAFDASRGTLILGPGASGSLLNNGDGTWTLSGVNSVNAAVYFKPAAGFDYSDVNMKYDVTVKNTAGSEYTFKGSSQVVIDAVADKPGTAVASNGSQVDYPHMTDPKTGNDVEQPAAKPGDKVTVHGTVTFPDTSGGEDHFILVENGKTANDAYTLESVTIKAGGQSLTVSDFSSYGTVNLSGVIYYKVPVDNAAFTNGDKIGSFDVDITIKTTGATTHDNTVGFGGRAEVATVPEGASGGAAGGSASTNYEFDKNNNESNTVNSVKVSTQVVDTKCITMNVGSAYENADRDAHLDSAHATAKYPNAQGFVPRADMLDAGGQFKAAFLDQVKADSAKIDFTAPTGANEVIHGLSVSFDCLKDGGGNFMQSTGNFMYGDKLIPLDFDGTVNGDHVICSYDAATGHVTLTIIPADGVYETTGQNLYFVPGESFRSDDIPLDFAAVVRDSASGYTKGFSSETGAAAQDMMDDLTDKMNIPTDANHMSQSIGGQDTSKPIDNTVEVDAVAQQAKLAVDASDVHSVYGDQYHNVVPGTVAKVTLDIDLRGDVLDKTESHFLYVKVPDNFSVDHFTVTYTGVDGLQHSFTVSGDTMGLQAVNASSGATGGVYFAWNFGNLVPAPATGAMDVDLYIKTPSNVSGKADFEAGVRSQEEWYKIQNQPGDKWEGELENNQANSWAKFEIPFSTCKQPGIGVGGYFYENSDKDAHFDPNVDKHLAPELSPYTPGAEDWRVPLNFNLGDGNDKLTGFSLSLQSGSAALGDLVVYAADGTTVLFRGDAISSLAELKAIFGVTGDMYGIPGKIVFEPAKDSFSGADPKLDYTIQLQDTASGQPKAISNVPYTDAFDGATKGANAGDLVITADSVAQRPSDLHFEADSGAATGGVMHEGDTRTVTVDATFTDVDGSTNHYILIEALGGWSLKVGGKTYGPDDLVTLEQGGKTYYKIDVSDQVNTLANQQSGNHTGSASVTVELIAPKGRMFLGDYEMEVKAGSTDKSEGGEITYHNNTAVISIDGLSGEVTRDGGDGRWYFEQSAALYEDNMPNQHTGDYTTTASGHIDVAGPAGGTIEIAVNTVNGQPVLDISGPGVTYNSGTGTYTIDITANGNAGVDVKLSDAYIQNGGANSDADLSFKSVTLVEPGGGGTHSLGGDSLKVLVDAVADQTAATGHSDHYTGAPTDHIGGNDTQYIGTDGVAGTKGAGGSDSVAHFEVEAKFGDIDGSEHHYILVEKTPAWGAPSGTAEVYIDGKTYYMFDVTAQANSGQTKFDIALTYQGGAGTGDDIFGSNAKGVTSYDLQFGTMSREHPIDGEFRIDNNTAINIDGEITLQYSPIDSTGGMSISQTVVDEWGGDHSLQAVTLGITGIATDKSDVLADLKINYNASAGQLYLVDAGGMKIAVATGFTGFTADQLAKLSSGEYKFSFEPNQFSHQDVNFSWSGTVKDVVSGVSETIGGSQKLVIDAVADHSDNTYTTDYGAGHTAALSGAAMTVTVTADFRDNVNTSEEHWVVLEQKDLRYSVTEVKIYNTNGELVGTYGPADIVTKFDEAGKPYFAVKMPDQGDYKVEFKVNTPQLDKDTTLSLDAGTIVIDTTKNGTDVEPDYSDNWTKDTKPITIETAVVEATTIKVAAESATMSEDSGKMKLAFSVTDGHNDSIKDVTINVPAGGKLIVNGTEYSSGSVKITADQLDKVYFEPGKNWSGTVNLDITSGTLIDNASGDTKAATTLTDGSFTVQGVADAPVAGSVTESHSAVSGSHNVSVTLSAQYEDTDGSENHFFLVKAPAGMTLNGSFSVASPAEVAAAGGAAGETWYKIPASSNTAASVSESITVTVAADYAGGKLSYVAVAEEKTPYADGKQYAASGMQEMNAVTIPNTAPVGAEAEVTAVLSAAAAMHGALDPTTLFTDAEHDVVTPMTVSFGGGAAVTLDPSGAVTVDGAHGTLTITGDGAGHFSYDYALHHGASVGTTDQDSFNFSGKDSYGADASSLGKLTFDFDEHHIVAQTTGGTINASAETHGVVIHGSDAADIITGSAHNDVIYGGGGNNEIHGGAGNDTIYAGGDEHSINLIHGGAGNDTMYGGAGKDTFLWLAEDFGNAATPASDTIHDFQLNSDTIHFKDVFGGGGSIDSLLDSAHVDSASRTVSFTNGTTTFEAEFKSDSELMLTLKDGSGNAVQTIDVHAATGTHFNADSASNPGHLDDEAAKQILQQMLKDGNV